MEGEGIVSGVWMLDWMERNWRRSWFISGKVKPVDRRRSKPLGAGVVVRLSDPAFWIELLDFGFDAGAMTVSAASLSDSSSAGVKTSPITQWIYTLSILSTAFPFPDGSGGGGGSLKILERTEVSASGFPLEMRR